MSIPTTTDLVSRYAAATPSSAALTERAKAVLPGGSTRTTGWHAPYPPVFVRGNGAWLVDADGQEHVDLFQNGLSLIHGEAFPPIAEEMVPVARDGTAFNGNVLGVSCGRVALEHLTPEAIGAMGVVASRLRGGVHAHAASLGLPLDVEGDFSLLALRMRGDPGWVEQAQWMLHLALVLHGVSLDESNVGAVSTVITPEVAAVTQERVRLALEDLARVL